MVYAIASIGLMGLFFGVMLAFAAKKFHVEIDPKVEEIMEALPGVNCGMCGYSGCAPFAEAVAAGEAEVGGCVPGGFGVATAIADIMGLEAGSCGEKTVAICLCQGGSSKAQERYIYDGIGDCSTRASLHGGSKACAFGCVGEGACMDVCPFDAIVMTADGLPVVDCEKCTSCGKCVVACPRKLMQIVPMSDPIQVLCINKDKAKKATSVCQVSCFKCKTCERSCPFDAIIVGDVAVIDHSKCMDCGICSAVCPHNTILNTALADWPAAYVCETEKCTGCNVCVGACPQGCISIDSDGRALIQTDRCIACGICARVCPVDAMAKVASEEADLETKRQAIRKTVDRKLISTTISQRRSTAASLASMIRK